MFISDTCENEAKLEATQQSIQNVADPYMALIEQLP